MLRTTQRNAVSTTQYVIRVKSGNLAPKGKWNSHHQCDARQKSRSECNTADVRTAWPEAV